MQKNSWNHSSQNKNLQKYNFWKGLKAKVSGNGVAVNSQPSGKNIWRKFDATMVVFEVQTIEIALILIFEFIV